MKSTWCNFNSIYWESGPLHVSSTRWRSGWGTALQTVRSRDRFPIVSLEFFIGITPPAALWLSLWQKWVPGIFPGGRGGRCVWLTTLPPSCAECLKIWTLNLLEPSGPLKACNGIVLSLPLPNTAYHCDNFILQLRLQLSATEPRYIIL
jgi:hypothetical protein